MKSKFRNFIELPVREKMLLFEAIIFQLISGLILKLVPFRMIPRIFRLPSHLSSQVSSFTSHIPLCGTSSLPLLVSPLTSQDIKRAILISGRLSPWKNKCLVQSLAARWMLNLRSIPSQLSLGVALGENGKMIAHSWLRTDDFEVVEKAGIYNELYFF